jgi:hypothetical protein
MATGSVSALDQDTWQLIQTDTISSSTSTVTLSSTTGYKKILVVGKAVGRNGYPLIRPNNDSSAGSYSAYPGDSTSFQIGWDNTGGAFYCVLDDVNKTVPHRIEGVQYSSNKTVEYWTNPVAITSVVLTNTGTMSSGTIYWYGIAG